MKEKDLAPSYFPMGLPPKYLGRSNVSRSEFGMESVWDHRANSTRKACEQNLQDCIATSNHFCFEVKPSVGSHASAAYITALPPSAD